MYFLRYIRVFKEILSLVVSGYVDYGWYVVDIFEFIFRFFSGVCEFVVVGWFEK